MIKLKRIDVLNDNIAILRDITPPEGIQIDQAALEKLSNEGVIAGVGPEAGSAVGPGDIVVFFPNKRYLELNPMSGGYEGRTVLLVRKADLMLRIGRTDKYEFIDKI